MDGWHLQSHESGSAPFLSGVGVYHLIVLAECIGGSYQPRVGYSPAANDVWSLGILLVNLLTGVF
jgi:hypothetical protein